MWVIKNNVVVYIAATLFNVFTSVKTIKMYKEYGA